ncbi:MAG: ComEC/Rec2 family competence protein, partial [Clostridia bacterium]|nr:ComEC/Rec2 family competence protein [Clostridia bacterium]
MKKTIINLRPMVFCALFLMAGIALSLAVMKNIRVFWLIAALSAVSAIAFAATKKKIAVVLALFFLAGFAGNFIQYITTAETVDGESNIRGKVAQINAAEGYYNIILKDLEIDGFPAGGRALVRVYGENPYELSDLLYFYGKIKTRPVSLADSSSLTYYGNGVYYNAVIMTQLSPPGSGVNFFDKLRLRMTTPMSKSLGKNKGIAASLLFGDLSGLSREDMSAIRDTGLSHIFSVSGLHISFVVACIALLLRRLRIKPLLSLAVTVIVLFVYCGVTGFPPSAVRSAVMAVIFMLSSVLHKKPDALNSLGAAVTLMLLFSPRTLFSLSFIMSVAAVFGILLFYKPLYKRFVGKGGRARRYLGASVAVSLSANVFLLPLSLNVFGTVSLYFVLANLLVLPIITVLYTYLFISGILCLVSP